jgi:AcrR family transcriptional regulator
MSVRSVIFVTRASIKSSAAQDCPKNPRGRPTDHALHDRRRGEILDKAVEVFAKHGYPNTDVQFVADPLKISKGTVYRYFKSKEELFLAAVAWGIDQLEDHMELATKHIEDPLEMMAVAVRAYLAFFRSRPALAELLIQERAEFRGRKKPVYFERRDTNSCPWRQRIEGLIAAGRVRPIPVERVLDVMGDLLYGTMFTNHMMGRDKPYEEQAQNILDVVFNGILTDEETARRARLIGSFGAPNGQNGGSRGVNGGRSAGSGSGNGNRNRSPGNGSRRPRRA